MLVEDLCPKCGGQSFVTNGILSCPLCGDQNAPEESVGTPATRETRDSSLADPEPEEDLEPLGPISFSLPLELSQKYAELEAKIFTQKCDRALEYLFGFLSECDALPEVSIGECAGNFFYEVLGERNLELARVCSKFHVKPENLMQQCLQAYSATESEDC